MSTRWTEDEAPTCPVCGAKVGEAKAEFGSVEVPGGTMFREIVSTSPRGDRLWLEPCGDVLRDEEVKPALSGLLASVRRGERS